MSQYFDKNPTVKSNIKEIKFTLCGLDIVLYSDNGVFSKSGLDEGTKIFVKTLQNLNINGEILDLGCGIGTVGITLKLLENTRKFTFSDVNLRALELTKTNLKKYGFDSEEVIESDGFTNIENKKFDYILFNPPIRIGKEKIFKIYSESINYLSEFGKFYLVIRKDKGMNSHLKYLQTIYNDSKIIYKERGYFILELSNNC